jgi:hypothetical protein
MRGSDGTRFAITGENGGAAEMASNFPRIDKMVDC